MDETQVFTLPNFSPAASDATIITSLAVTFYIKIDTPPTNLGELFYYWVSSVKY